MPYLTRAIVSRGPVIDILVGVNNFGIQQLRRQQRPIPHPVKVEALIDTGAVVTCIDYRAIQSLNLAPTNFIRIAVPAPSSSAILCDQYDLALTILHPTDPQLNLVLNDITVTDAPVRATGIDALIGCDLLRKWQFVFDGRAGTFTLDY